MFSAADVIRALSFTTQWANSADDKMMIFFFSFFFFPVTRIWNFVQVFSCMKCQSLYVVKIRKTSNSCLLKILRRVLSIKG